MVEPTRVRTSQGHLFLCRLRSSPVLLGYEIRERDRLAELLSSVAARHRDQLRQEFFRGPHRSALPALRRTSRTRIRRRAETDRLALLHGRRRFEVHASLRIIALWRHSIPAV